LEHPKTKIIYIKGHYVWNTLPGDLKGIESARKFVDCVKQSIANVDTS